MIAIENARLFEEVQARTRELEARTRELTESLEQQTAASEILRVIARSPTDVQPVFDTIATSVARLCGARYCVVFRFDGELVHFVAQHGLPPEGIAGNQQNFPMPPGRGSAAARSILSRTVEQIPDVEADPDFAHGSISVTRAVKVRSLLAVPMLKGDVPAGAIVVARPETGFFPERQVELVETLADQAVIAIRMCGCSRKCRRGRAIWKRARRNSARRCNSRRLQLTCSSRSAAPRSTCRSCSTP